MKRISLAIVLTLFSLCTLCVPHAQAQSVNKPAIKHLSVALVSGSGEGAGATSTASGFTKYVFSWGFTANAPNCPASGTPTNCIAGFTIVDTSDANLLIVGAGNGLLQLGPGATTYTYSPVGGVPYGSKTFSIVASGYDGNGLPLNSAPLTVVASVGLTNLNAPTNFTETTN